MLNNIQNQESIMKRWAPVVNAVNDIKSADAKMATAIVLENTQNALDERFRRAHSNSLVFEDITAAGTMGPWGAGSYAHTATQGGQGDARVPNVVIPMVRRIFPQLLAHDLVGVQPMQNPVGMAFAFRAKYGAKGAGGGSSEGTELGYTYVNAAHTGVASTTSAWFNLPNNTGYPDVTSTWQNDNGNIQPSGINDFDVFRKTGVQGWDKMDKYKPTTNITTTTTDIDIESIFGSSGQGADLGDSENWAIGENMPEAGYEFLKATVTAKTRKLGVRITREAEEDMKAMQGINAQAEINDMLSYEIQQEIDRQLLVEIAKAAASAGNAHAWSPNKVFGQSQVDRVNALYTTLLGESARIAVQNRRGAANWCVCSPTVAALMEAQIYNPLTVAGGLGNADAFGKDINNNIGVTQIGALRNGTIKLYRDTLAQGDYMLLGYKGNNVYDAGIIYLPYIPLEIVTATDPKTMNPMTAARTRYGITTNLFGAGQFYSLITFNDMIDGNGATDNNNGFFQW